MKRSTISNAGDKLNAGFKDQHRVKSNTTNGDVEHLGVCGMQLQVSNSSVRDHEPHVRREVLSVVFNKCW